MARGRKMSHSRICHFVICFVLIPAIIAFLGISLSLDHWLKFTVNRHSFSSYQEKNTWNDKNLAESSVAYSREIGLIRECFLVDIPGFLKWNNMTCRYLTYEVPEEKQGQPLSLGFWQHLQLSRVRLICFLLALFCSVVSLLFAICAWSYQHHCIGIFACIFLVLTGFMICLSLTAFHAMEFIETDTIQDNREVKFQKYWPTYIRDATTRSYGVCYILAWTAFALTLIPAFLFGLVTFQFKAEHYNRLRDNYEHHVPSDVSTVMKTSSNYCPVTFGPRNQHNDHIFIYESNKAFPEMEGKYIKS